MGWVMLQPSATRPRLRTHEIAGHETLPDMVLTVGVAVYVEGVDAAAINPHIARRGLAVMDAMAPAVDAAPAVEVETTREAPEPPVTPEWWTKGGTNVGEVEADDAVADPVATDTPEGFGRRRHKRGEE